MQKLDLIDMMTGLLQGLVEQARLDEGGDGPSTVVAADTPLIGEQAVVTSMNLVSFIADVETTLADRWELSITLVNEKALSRKNSPFRTIDALADYILELALEPARA